MVTIQEIAPYLPYGLQIKILNYQCDYVGIEYAKATGFYLLGDTLHVAYEGGSTGKDPSIFKPILRPLSDLTREICHNGEKFIPIVRLLEMKERQQFSKDQMLKSCSKNATVNVIGVEAYESKSLITTGMTIYSVEYALKTINMGTLVYKLSYDDHFDRFSLRDETREINLGVGHQKQMFEKLYEWGLDLNSLIPRGLAIDINTLPPC